MMLAGLKNWSIARRMMISAVALILLVLPIAGGLLAWNFREAVNTSFNDRLESLLNVVIAGVAYNLSRDALMLDRQLGDPRFDRVFSGWYWQVSDGSERVITSRSLWDQRLPVTEGSQPVYRQALGPRGQTLRLAARTIQIPNLADPVHVAVAADLTEVRAEVSRFHRLLIVSLATLGSLLLLLIGLQIRWGLDPLRRVEKSLKEVEAGQQNALATDFPEELARLARAINLVLERDQILIERGRSAAGNLAHALKTPLTVLATLSEQLSTMQKQAFRAELQRLNAAVRHHLARASAAGPVGLGRQTDLMESLTPVFTALDNLAARRGVVLEKDCRVVGPVRFEKQDIQEIVGNLVENAVNWAQKYVEVVIDQSPNKLTISVGDDGLGMSDSQCAEALNRGARLDEERSGSGLGLSIVNDLVRIYGGTLQLTRSRHGGLLASIELPV
ncbi:MAG: HAMP domain-containing sensor histidine kinase [Marinobacter sp.]|uniref:HAMP domain-containing sensor histidine kinase n=2 Tax=Marinobacter sp. TaxID=50741 RepID=UPI0032973CA4